MSNQKELRKKYFDSNGVSIEDKDYILREPCEEYKDGYFELCKETYVIKEQLEDEDYRRVSWEILFKVGVLLFIIEKTTNNFCGYVQLKHIDSDQPEIGIELLKKYQHQGIGYRTIRLMLNKAQQVHPVSSYKIKIYNDNISSQKLFEKLGAERIGEEESEIVKFMREAKEIFKEKAVKDFSSVYNDFTEEKSQIVYVYKLSSDKI